MNYLLIITQLYCKMALLLVLLVINSQQVNAELPLLDCPGPGCPSVNQNQPLDFRNPNRSKDEIKVYIHNLCSKTIFASIHYKDKIKGLQTTGWWVLKKGEKILVAQTTGDLIYLYAESEPIDAPQTNNEPSVKKARLKWGGESKFLPIKAGQGKVGFFQKKIDTEDAESWVEIFECD